MQTGKDVPNTEATEFRLHSFLMNCSDEQKYSGNQIMTLICRYGITQSVTWVNLLTTAPESKALSHQAVLACLTKTPSGSQDWFYALLF